MATQASVELESARARMQKAGLTVEQLREIQGGLARPDVLTRAREAGLTLEEVRALLGGSREPHG
jgi:hypothetical protein